MPYQTNPTFTAGNVLTAAQLNVLSENIAYLYSLIGGPNTPFTGEKLTGTAETRRWTFRRKGRYLHYKMRLLSGTSDELDIRLGSSATIEYTDATNRSSVYTWSGYIDLTTTTENPAIGDFYEFYVEFDAVGTVDFRVDYFIESDNTTL